MCDAICVDRTSRSLFNLAIRCINGVIQEASYNQRFIGWKHCMYIMCHTIAYMEHCNTVNIVWFKVSEIIITALYVILLFLKKKKKNTRVCNN